MTECLRDKPDTGAGNRIESMGGGGWREEEPGLPREGPGACWLAAAVGCCAVWRPGRCARRCFFFSLVSLELLPSCPAFSKRPGLGWPELPSMAAGREHVPARASLVGFWDGPWKKDT